MDIPSELNSHKAKQKKQSPKGASRAPALDRAPPGPHSGEGLVRPPSPTSVRLPTRASRTSVATKQNRRGKSKNQTQEARKHPCRLASRGLGRGERAQAPQVPGESRKRAGPRMAPRENAKKQDARPKRAINQARRGKRGGPRTDKNKCMRGCLVTTDLSLLKNKKQKKQK